MLLIPKKFNPRIRDDINFLRPTHFEGSWVEITPTTGHKRQSYIVGLAYNPKKSYKEFFIEDVLKSVDYVFAEGKPLFLMGDFNINYRLKSEKELVSNALIPYSLTVTNKLTPTRYDNENGTVIDYIIADKRDVKYTHVSEAPFCTGHNILICGTNIKRKVIVKAKKVDFF